MSKAGDTEVESCTRTHPGIEILRGGYRFSDSEPCAWQTRALAQEIPQVSILLSYFRWTMTGTGGTERNIAWWAVVLLTKNHEM